MKIVVCDDDALVYEQMKNIIASYSIVKNENLELTFYQTVEELLHAKHKPQERRKATGTGGIPPENIRLRRTLTTEYLQLSLCYGVRDRMSIETAGFTGWR